MGYAQKGIISPVVWNVLGQSKAGAVYIFQAGSLLLQKGKR